MPYLRLLIYSILFTLSFIVIYWKIQKIQKNKDVQIVSIINENKSKGIPVKIKKVKPENMVFFQKLSIKFLSPKKAIAFINKEERKNLSKGQKIYDIKNLKQPIGYISYINNQSSIDNGLYKITSLLFNPIDNKSFLPILVKIKEEEQVIKIPLIAIQQNQDNFFVWTVEKNNLAIKKIIKLGEKNQKFTNVTQGLKYNDQVIINGFRNIKENTKVRKLKF